MSVATDAPVIIAAIITAGAGAFGWLLRGQIRSTNADKLWDAAEEMRQELRAEVKALEVRVRECEKTRASQSVEIMNLRESASMNEKKIDSLIQDNGYLTRRVQELEKK